MKIRSLYRNFFYILFALIMVLPAVSLAQPARVEAATQAEIDAALDSGVAWLVTKQDAGDGHFEFGDDFDAANTGFAVVTLEHYAEQLGKTPLDPAYTYSTNVQKGLDYLFSSASGLNYDATNQWVWWESTGHNVYVTGPCLLPIARSGAPTALVGGVGPLSALNYKQVAQYTVNWLGSAQVLSGTNTGAWYYTKGSTSGDQSVVGWVTMGLGYAVHSMGCDMPSGLLTRLSLWNTYIQCKTAGASFNGAGYTSPCYWVNTYKTGSLLFGDALCGDTKTTPRVVDALSFLDGYWNSPTNGSTAHSDPTDAGWRGASPPTPTSSPAPSYMATLSCTKGFTELGITTFSGHDWYQDFAEVIVRTQHADKSWVGGGYDEEESLGRSTCWALMTLLKVHSAPPTPPTVTAVNPASGTQGQCPMTVIITGTNFTGATTVSFGPGITASSFTVNSATQITANICIVVNAATGARDVSVTTTGGTGTGTALFTVVPPPTVTNVNPASGIQGQCPTVIITGTDFTGATAVNFGTGITVNSFTVDSATQITANICIVVNAATGARDVSVTTPNGTGTGTALFTVNAPAVVPVPEVPRSSPTWSRPLNPAQMSVQYLNVSPQQASANQPVTITTNVVNTGDEGGNYYLALKINGQVEKTKMVSVGAQGTQPVKLTVTKAQPGTYTVDIGGQRGSFVVLGAGGTASTHASGGLIIILIMSVLILSTVVVLMITFRHPA